MELTDARSMAGLILNMPLLPLDKDIQVIDWQTKTVEEILHKLYTPYAANSIYTFKDGIFGCMLRGGTGIGKMYITCHAIRRAIELKLIKMPEGSNCPFPVVWVLPANIMIQTQRVLKQFGLSMVVHCMTYHAFRGKGNPYVVWKDVGTTEEHLVPIWKRDWLPSMIIVDECQNLRNPATTTTQVAMSLVDATHKYGVKVIFASATPYQRLCETRCVATVLGVVTKYNQLPLVNDTFPSVIGDIAAQGKGMYDYSPKSMKNFRDALDYWYVEPKNVRFKFPAKTNLIEIPLVGEKREKYNLAYQEYLRKIWELQRRTGPQGIMAKWVALGKFQEAAELLRADILAARAKDHVTAGKQVIVGSKYVNTLRAVWLHLTKNLGVPPDRIAFVVGGQSKEKRQLNVDAFQMGAADYMLLMMRAGGVGLSLHHDRQSKFSRPRRVVLPPTYAAPELVQVLGRGHRLTSLSPTEQDVVWFADTVESDKVLPRVRSKLRCLDAAVVAKEQWGHMLESSMIDEERDVEKLDRLEEEYGSEFQRQEHTEEPSEEGEEGSDNLESLTGEGLNNED